MPIKGKLYKRATITPRRAMVMQELANTNQIGLKLPADLNFAVR